jgi:hypothetical protein
MLTLFVATSLVINVSLASAAAVQDIAVDRPPMGLHQLGDSCIALFDEALAGRWNNVSAEMAGIDKTLTTLPLQLPYPDVVARMRSRVRSLRRNVAERRTVPVLDDANAVTRLVAQIADGFEVSVPFDIAILPYYGRQLKIGVVGRRSALLRRTTQDLQATWTRAEPRVVARGHTAEAQRFTDVIVDLEGARRIADFSRAAKAELRAAASVKGAFD